MTTSVFVAKLSVTLSRWIKRLGKSLLFSVSIQYDLYSARSHVVYSTVATVGTTSSGAIDYLPEIEAVGML